MQLLGSGLEGRERDTLGPHEFLLQYHLEMYELGQGIRITDWY